LSARSSVLVLLAALGLLVPAFVGLGLLPGTGSPTPLAPVPALTAIPALLLDRFAYAALLVPSLLFLAWNPQLFRSNGKIPRRSFGLFVMTTVLSILYFALGWRDAAKYWGVTYTVTVCLVNAAWATLLGLWFHKRWNVTPAFAESLLLHWMLFAWLCWYAFPWLGEGI
jgi:hypothetical protein